MPDLTQLDAYDYQLPEELIAQQPLPQRDAARLLVIDREAGSLSHRSVRDLPAILKTGDCLVLNTTKVVPARLLGVRTQTGGAWEGLFLGLLPDGKWNLIGQTRGRIREGETVTIKSPEASLPGLELRLESRGENGTWNARPLAHDDPFQLLDRYGHVPLPPYIRHGEESAEDRQRYQTVFANQPGSAAAPTAGLHFTDELLQTLQERGISRAEVLLHVGLGTFRPVNVADIREHAMHAEWCRVPEETATYLHRVKAERGRVVAVGTTSLRTLETAAAQTNELAWEGESRLFIYPPYQFRVVDALLTNFHLPKSTLLMLVCALAGYDLAMSAYREAIRERYRFFSYGDAMLII